MIDTAPTVVELWSATESATTAIAIDELVYDCYWWIGLLTTAAYCDAVATDDDYTLEGSDNHLKTKQFLSTAKSYKYNLYVLSRVIKSYKF